jgi:hypothetical protein
MVGRTEVLAAMIVLPFSSAEASMPVFSAGGKMP